MGSPVISEVILGHTWIKPEYPSFYPEELVAVRAGADGLNRLYVCPWCFKYSQDIIKFRAHMDGFCEFKDVNQCFEKWVYEDAERGISVCEIDGEEMKLFAQNLSLFTKLFLDTKSVFYDVTTFLFYLLIYRDPLGPRTAKPQIVGFFSKEKLSWDNNNLACILVFPPWQRRGLGQVLMGLSYLVSRREKRLGGPEKPLSELGRFAYIHYWASVVTRYILGIPAIGKKAKYITIREVSNATYILPEDILMTCKEMGILESRKQNANTVRMMINRARVQAWAQEHRISMTEPVDHEAFDVLNPPEEESDEEEESGAENNLGSDEGRRNT